MAKSTLKIPTNTLNDIVERMFEKTVDFFEPKIIKQMAINKKRILREGDLVKCMYKTGIFKVYGFRDDKVVIAALDGSGDFEYVSQKYLTFQKVNKKVVKVLYEN